MSIKIDPRVKRTKGMFEAALLELMEEKDYEKITVMDLAKKSGLNRGTFYLHYYDKEDLLEQCLNVALNDLRESVRLPDVEFSYQIDRPHPTFIRLFSTMMDNAAFYKNMLADAKIPYFTEHVTVILEALVSKALRYLLEDGIEFTVPIEIITAYIVSAYMGVIIWWLKNNMPYTPEYIAVQLTIMSTVGHYVKNPYI